MKPTATSRDITAEMNPSEMAEVEMNPTHTEMGEEVEMNSTNTEMAEEIEMKPSTRIGLAEEMNPSTTTEIAEVVEMNPTAKKTTDMELTINIPSTSQSPPPPPPIHPNLDLLARREDYFNICVPLYQASVTGDWAAAHAIFDARPELVRYAITEGYDTPLHVAASAEGTKLTEHFVMWLVELMSAEDLELRNRSSNTAFCLAAAAENIKMVDVMIKKNRNLMNIPGAEGMMPLYMSALRGRHITVRYLYQHSQMLTHETWGLLLLKCVECDLFDVALQIVVDHPELATNGFVLGALARKPDAFDGAEQNLLTRIKNSMCGISEEDSDALKLLRIIWQNTIKKMSKDEVDDILKGPRDEAGKYSSRILFVAAEMGNAKFVIELIRAYPDLIWKTNNDTHSIFHVAVMNRCHDIHNLLYEIGTVKDLITPHHDRDGNNMFHLVGKTSVKMRPQTYGASLLMQRELLWFKEIEKMVPHSLRERKNKDGKTPYELFSEENKDLVSQGLKWMKDCMIVATLIVTVAFAVAFTVPGGYKQEIGFPVFIHGRSFLVFVIADAISLFSSSTSLLVFLSIFTSRHGQRDFMYSLPRKLMIGLVTLFISVAALMITFSASFFVLYHNKLKWVPMLIGAFAVMPVIAFAILEFPLLVDIFRSMYDSRYLFKPKKRMLYNTNPRL